MQVVNLLDFRTVGGERHPHRVLLVGDLLRRPRRDGSSQGNKPRPGFEGPSPNIPEESKPGYTPATAEEQQATLNNVLGLVSKTDAMKQLAGVGTSSTAAQSEKDKLTGKLTDLS